ncbi:hypothetical protein KI387_006619 [Taxus chinensis]|uniref:Exocyst subunit Exo70 family protein n=1 Tax=Taxus chinensis TaxID=29808 RepID=A0AA38GPR1_TAXCH|nr:hypothetical protein KI387_006619 [Taxus chinensis]
MSMEIEVVGENGTVAVAVMSVNTPGRNNLGKAEENLGTANVEENLDLTERFISKWDINTTNKILFQGGKEEVRKYMHTVHNLHQHMKHLSAGGSSTELIRSQPLMKMAMARLQKEFHKILLSNSEPMHPDRWSGCSNRSDNEERSSGCSSSIRPSTDRIYEFNRIPLEAVVNLRSIAQCMGKSGYAKECVRIFTLIRKSVVDESFATYSQDLFRSVPEQADGILVRLGEAIRGILTEFEEALKNEKSKAPIVGDTVHPLTRYAMNYLTFLPDYKESLIKLTTDTPAELADNLALDDSPDSHSARISTRFVWIIFFLVCKLEEKSGPLPRTQHCRICF